MSRTIREVVPGQPHHVWTRGNNRRRLFSFRRDFRAFLWYLAVSLDNSRCSLNQLTLMTNHVHMIVNPPSRAAFIKFNRTLNQRYAQYRNKTRKASGKLFEQRYGSKVIRSNEQLAATTVYSDANAFRAGMISDPIAHRWSTAGLHAGSPELTEVPATLLTPSAWYLGLGATEDERAEKYRAFLKSYLEAGRTPESHIAAVGVEELSTEPYSRRLLRPDGTSAF